MGCFQGQSFAVRVALGLACFTVVAQGCFASQQKKNTGASGSAREHGSGALRIVAPGAVAEPYFGEAPGGRFAVLADAIVDLKSARIAWRSADPVYLAFASRPHTLVRAARPEEASNQPASIQLWSALSGQVEATFPGTPLAHSELDGLMPLQDKETLLIVDALAAQELARIPMPDEALSAVLRGEELWLLSRKRATRSEKPKPLAQEQLTLQSFKWPSAEAGKKYPIKLDWRGHQPKPATEHRSPPFLQRDEQGALGIARIFRSAEGEAGEKTELYRIAINDKGRIQATSWTVTPYTWPDNGKVAALEDKSVRPIPTHEPPDNVRDALARLPRVPSGNMADALRSRVLTHGEGYFCVWSLRSARREACLRVRHSAAGLEDGGIWLEQENGRAGSWNVGQGLKWEAKSGEKRESGRSALDCELTASNEPGSATIVVSDSEGPRFYLYDLGPDAWAIALPDGHYVGSPGAEKKLAFYDERGALVTGDDVTASMDATRVGEALSAAVDCER